MTYYQTKFKDWKRKTKYGNISTVYAGTKYDSKFEAKVAQDLDFRLKAGELKEVQKQVTIDLMVNDTKVGTYRIDFVAHRTDGTTEWIEAKGFETALWKLKWRIFEAMMKDEKDAELIIVKQR